MNTSNYTSKQINRFWAKVNIPDDPDACWEWKAGKKGDGYGCIRIDGIQRGAHRISYEINVGEIPAGLHVLHTCDNPGCVNPKHLWLGTHKDNMQDRELKGRGGRRGGYRGGHRGKYISFANGKDHPNSKLTWEKVREIRRLYTERVANQQGLADMFGVSNQTISDIIRKRTWIE